MGKAELQISASEFKAKCLGLFDRLGKRKIKRIVVTKRGRPVAVMGPPPAADAAAASLFGCLKGRMTAPPGFDFAAPALDEKLDAEEGRLFR
jgi:hypothetical protein